MRNYFAQVICFMLLFFLIPFELPPYAQESTSNTSQNDLENKIVQYEQKLNVIRQQKNTLSSQIQYMDTQISLTTLRIQETGQKIIMTEKEIKTLTSRIEGLDDSLNYLSKLLLERIVEGYKKRSVSLFTVFFDSDTADVFLNRTKYLKTAQENNQKLLVQVQETKLNFEEQKKLREEKKKELDRLKNTLTAQKIALNNQKIAKQQLLEVTKNDENTYQQLLDEARKQLSSFKSFVQTAGGGVIESNGFGSGKKGWYLSQRDQRWAYSLIGLSNENILEVGCLIADIAMMYTKYGETVTPADIASQAYRFFSNTALMLVPWKGPGGRVYTYISKSQIDAELAQGNPVIVGLYAGKYGTHYVILDEKKGNDYSMYDPYYGPDLLFSSYYSFNSIFSVVVFR